MTKSFIVLCFALLVVGMEHIVHQTLFKKERVSQKALDATEARMKTTASLTRCGMLCKEGCDAFKFDRLTENCR